MTDDSTRVDRRSVLAVVGGGLLAGCSAPTTTDRSPRTTDDERTDDERTTEAATDLSVDTGWGMFGRNARHTSHSPDASGPRTDATQQWSHTCAQDQGDILGTPAVADGIAYVGCGRSVEALDVTTGAVEWSRTLSRTNRFSPALGAGRVYVTIRGERAGLYGFARDGGDTEWHQPLQVVSAPVYADGTVYARTRTAGKTLRAFDADDGTEQWHHGRDCQPSDAVWSPPTVWDDTVLYLATCADGERSTLFALDRATGTERWHHEIDGVASRSAPAVADGVAYVGDNGGRLYAIDLEARRERWTTPLEGQLWTTPTIGHDTVYVGSVTGTLYAVDAAEGAVDWHRNVGLTYETAAFDGETLYVGGVNLQGVDPASGETLWRVNTTNTFSSQFASPAVVGNAVVATSCVKTDSQQTRYDNRIHVVG
ncbi:PQQ-binding-like beta-propeller repeat protein [Halomicrobium sp. HM KBTZ05]|uniref:outer membrane protein assembly factor BamB family protein n=1 Tax=Halomicrobium sp. HM KBTZ05 TaxID=3242663 RepID=UPI003557B442